MPVRPNRRRYAVFRVLSEEVLSGSEVFGAVRESISTLLGEVGSSRVLFTPVFYDERRGEGILRCSNRDLLDLRAAMALIGHIGSKRASIIVKGVSGTLRAAKAKFLSE